MSDDQPVVLLIDDEPDILQLLSITLNRMKIKTVCAIDVHQANKCLAEQPYDFCITDMRLPDGSGLDIVRTIHRSTPNTPVAVLTAHGNMETAIKALKLGAFDFVSKPIELPKLRELVKSALKLRNTSQKPNGQQQNDLVGSAPAMIKLQETIAKVARSQAPVAIYGESGTGKELVAKLIHSSGHREDKPFIPVNCGAIPSELMESELFGHIKGSFTGAVSDKEGLFQLAQGGTLFLDEVAELPLSMQVKLLRVIQEKSVRPVGGSAEIPCDVRILSATHKNLNNQVLQGLFRQDLYYRLNVIELNVPPLRERRQDIPAITKRLLEKNNPHLSITDAALKKLSGFEFLGNVRELENVLERSQALMEGDTIQDKDVEVPNHQRHGNDVSVLDLIQQKAEESGSQREGLSLEEYVEKIEKSEIMAALEETKYNKTAAAKLLGISFRSLRYKLQKLGMD
jgi:two-component system response regulator PilR (NtrC family)